MVRNTPWLAFSALALSHSILLLAGFVAPYDYKSQNREFPFAPPTHIHFFDTHGKLHFRPFIYNWSPSTGDTQSREDRSVCYPIRLFTVGAPYRILNVASIRLHLFGTDEPGRIFLFGSDAYGRDEFSRLLFGARISLFAGLFATLISLTLGLGLGGIAGFYGRWIDEIVMRAAEIFLAVPWLYLLFAIRAFLPLSVAPNYIFLLLTMVIGILGWARSGRLVRGIVLSAKEREFVTAARGFGAGNFYLLRRHILPEASGVALTQAAALIPHYVLAEVTLSFLGLGIGEPVPSLGNMLASLQQTYVLESYWWMLLPALVLIPIFLAYYSVFSYYSRSYPLRQQSSHW